MNQKMIYGAVLSAALLFAAGGAAAISAAAKPAPEAVASAQITPQNIEAQREKMEGISPNELADGVQIDVGEGQSPIIQYRDQDNNLYTYSSDGTLLGMKKFLKSENLPTLSEDELRETAQLYLEGMTDRPERYTLRVFEATSLDYNVTCYNVVWSASCCGYRTLDQISVQMNSDGTLRGYHAQHNGAFDNVIVTAEQIEDAIDRAKRKALPEGETDQRRFQYVGAPEDIVLTVDDDGNLLAIVTVAVEVYTGGLSPSGDGWYGAADDYFIPLFFV